MELITLNRHLLNTGRAIKMRQLTRPSLIQAGLSPVHHWAIISTSAGLLINGPMGNDFR